MPSPHNTAVAARFARRAASYDAHAGLQAEIAAKLAQMLPARVRPRVLEVGCGTGLLTRHLLARYPDGDFLITDLAPEMLDRARARVGRNGRALRFAVMDGEAPDGPGRFDLIATAMTLQWFADPCAGVARLRGLLAPGGRLCFATLGGDGFPEWRAALAAEGLPDGLTRMPRLPGIVHEERRVLEFPDALAFLRRLKGLGATLPRAGYRPLGSAALRRALARLDADRGARVTWHIVYGCLLAGND